MDPSVSVCYFFFQTEVGTTSNTLAAAAYRAILAQLLHKHRHNEKLIDKFIFDMVESSMGQPDASQKNLVGLMQLCGQELGPLYIVLDGIDECSDKEALLGTLPKIVALPSIKLLLLSRPTVLRLLRKTTDDQRLQMTRTAVKDDITTYVTNNVLSLIEEDYLPDVPLKALVDPLVAGADGMFLWAKLMVKLLHSPILIPARRLAMITSIIHPEGLEEMYDRVLSLVSESTRLEKGVAKKVFCWLAFAKAPVTVGLLHELIHKCLPDQSDLQKAARDFRGVIGATCGALVEFDDTVADNTGQSKSNVPCGFDGRVRFIHLSVKEYFSEMTSLSNPTVHGLVMEPPMAHLAMARETLGVLLNFEPSSISCAGNMLEYAALYWVNHLQNSVATFISEDLAQTPEFKSEVRDFIGSLDCFLDKPFIITCWIHSFYQLGKEGADFAFSLRELQGWLDWLHSPGAVAYAPSTTILDISHRLVQFIKDMTRLVNEWGAKLKDNPDLLWDETAAFMCSKFIFTSSVTSVTRLAAPSNPRPLDVRSEYIVRRTATYRPLGLIVMGNAVFQSPS